MGTDWDTDAASLFWFVVPGIVIPLALTVLAFWSPNRRQLRRWGAACDVVITPANEQQIARHLGRSRRFRSLASLPFWWLAFVPGVEPDVPAAIATPVLGLAAYLVGALVAELTGSTARPDGVRRAALVPRLVADYRPRWLRRLTLAMFAVAGGAIVLRATVVPDPSGSARALGASLALAAVVTGVAELAARRIVERPQRGTDADQLAGDEGLKAAAVSMTSGAALLAAMYAAAAACASAVPADTGAWAALLIPWVLVLQAFGFGVLVLIVRQETWGYRRRYVQRPVAVAA